MIAERIAASTQGLRLPAQAVQSLADLIAAGYGLVEALDALPRSSLPERLRGILDHEVKALRHGAPVDDTLDKLGLEITLIATRGAKSGTSLVQAVKSDAERLKADEEARRTAITRVLPFAVIALIFAALGLYMSLIMVPAQIADVNRMIPSGDRLPQALENFEAYRNRLALGALSVVLTIGGWIAFNIGWMGPDQFRLLLHSIRLYVPFLRAHARHSARARLVEALRHEQTAGIAANVTLRRAASREPVPRLRDELELAAKRLEAGDPWASSLRGTLLETPFLVDLNALASRGAKPDEGWKAAAALHRDGAITALRRAVLAGAVIVITPISMYSMSLLQAATVAGSVAELEKVRRDMDRIQVEIQSAIDSAN